MKQKHEFKNIVAETLLIPLYMRAKESRRNNPRTVWNTITPNSTGQS